jgi:hypothetical protein
MNDRIDESRLPSAGWLAFGIVMGLAGGLLIAAGPGRVQLERARSRTLELTAGKPVQRARAVAARVRNAGSDPNHPVRKLIERGANMSLRGASALTVRAAPEVARSPLEGNGDLQRERVTKPRPSLASTP